MARLHTPFPAIRLSEAVKSLARSLRFFLCGCASLREQSIGFAPGVILIAKQTDSSRKGAKAQRKTLRTWREPTGKRLA